MRLLVVSDTHGRLDRMEDSMPMLRAIKGDLLVHLGDHARDAELFAKRLSLPVVALPGNCDFCPGKELERVLPFGEKRLLLCHGHTLGVKSGLDRLLRRAKALGCDAALFGHTHLPHQAVEDGVLLLNPGSLGYAPDLGSGLGIGVLELEDGQLRAALL